MSACFRRRQRWFRRWFRRWLGCPRWAEIQRSDKTCAFELQRKLAVRIAERLGAVKRRSEDGSTI